MFMPSEPLPETGPECVAELAELEALKSRIAARQVRVASRLVDLRSRASESSQGAEIGLARRESPTRGRVLCRTAVALVDDFPEVLGLMEAGELSERRAELIVTEARHLPMGLRGQADSEIVRELAERPGLGDRGVQALARRVVCRLDDAAAAARRARAVGERRIVGRSCGDGTWSITARVADHHAVSILQALGIQANKMKAQNGETRTHAQLMADVFVERLTLSIVNGLPLALSLILPAESLLGDGDEPAELDGFGPIPASVARQLVLATPVQKIRVRRLFAYRGALVAMESRSRLFDGLLRRFIELRDQRCRTPYCDAPVRQIDHLVKAAHGGPTSVENAAGRCQACNLLMEEPGWGGLPVDRGVEAPHETITVTPEGQTHERRAPDPPGDPLCGYREVQPGVYELIA